MGMMDEGVLYVNILYHYYTQPIALVLNICVMKEPFEWEMGW